MNTKRTTVSRRGVKLVGAACAGAAVIGAGVLTVVLDDDGGSTHATTLAGSGSAPASTSPSQPSVSAMTLGATATFTTPASVEATTEAVPPVKAGH